MPKHVVTGAILILTLFFPQQRLSAQFLDLKRVETAINAIRLIEISLKFRPADAVNYTNLGMFYSVAGDLDNSLRFLKTARNLRPDHARAYYNLGHTYRQMGDNLKAIEAYRRYIAIGEKGEEARLERARQLIVELSKQ